MKVTPRSRCWNGRAPTWKITVRPFDLALTITRAGNLFTTHTPVEAGFDRFAPELDGAIPQEVCRGETFDFVRRASCAGTADRQDSSEPFNMAYLAVRGSGAVNGVSQLHGQVSRRIFQPLFPRWPEDRSAGDACDQRRAHCLPGTLRKQTACGN